MSMRCATNALLSVTEALGDEATDGVTIGFSVFVAEGLCAAGAALGVAEGKNVGFLPL